MINDSSKTGHPMEAQSPMHTTIGVVSDTHMPQEGPLPVALLQQLEEVDLILHLGDFNDLPTLRLFQQMKPLIAVYGNLDEEEIRGILPERRVLTVGEFTLGLAHGWGPPTKIESRVRRLFPEADIVLFGHSHTPFATYEGSQLLFNPGSATCNREGSNTFGIIKLSDRIEHRIISLD